MEKQFVSFAIAKVLNEKGFNQPCFGFYHIALSKKNGIEVNDLIIDRTNSQKQWPTQSCLAPTYQQAVDWFRDKYNLIIDINYNYNNPMNWTIHIIDINKAEEDLTSVICSGIEFHPCYYGDYYQALDKGITEALKLI